MDEWMDVVLLGCWSILAVKGVRLIHNVILHNNTSGKESWRVQVTYIMWRRFALRNKMALNTSYDVAMWRPSFLHFGRLHVHLFVAHDLRTEKRRKSLYVKKNVGMEKNKICWKYVSLTPKHMIWEQKKEENLCM